MNHESQKSHESQTSDFAKKTDLPNLNLMYINKILM